MDLINPFKAALGRGEVQIGLWLAMAAPYTAELCANAGRRYGGFRPYRRGSAFLKDVAT